MPLLGPGRDPVNARVQRNQEARAQAPADRLSREAETHGLIATQHPVLGSGKLQQCVVDGGFHGSSEADRAVLGSAARHISRTSLV